jgi:intein-encoded DNA endonuclease-like protein
MPIQREVNHDFFKTWTPEMAYVLGYFAADGSMVANARGAHFIEFTSTDKILLSQVQRVIESTHTLAKRVRNPTHKQQYRIQIGSKAWYSDLTQLGFVQSKSCVLRFPVLPKKYRADFIRGYFDGDGCVYSKWLQFADRKRKRFVFQTLFTSGSKRFLVSLHGILSRSGLRGGSLVAKVRGFELKFSTRDSVALYHFMYHTSRVSVYLPRKRKAFERAMKSLGSKMRL